MHRVGQLGSAGGFRAQLRTSHLLGQRAQPRNPPRLFPVGKRACNRHSRRNAQQRFRAAASWARLQQTIAVPRTWSILAYPRHMPLHNRTTSFLCSKYASSCVRSANEDQVEPGGAWQVIRQARQRLTATTHGTRTSRIKNMMPKTPQNISEVRLELELELARLRPSADSSQPPGTIRMASGGVLGEEATVLAKPKPRASKKPAKCSQEVIHRACRASVRAADGRRAYLIVADPSFGKP